MERRPASRLLLCWLLLVGGEAAASDLVILDMRVIEAEGGTVIPGLIDAHVQVPAAEGPNGHEVKYEVDEYHDNVHGPLTGLFTLKVELQDNADLEKWQAEHKPAYLADAPDLSDEGADENCNLSKLKLTSEQLERTHRLREPPSVIRNTVPLKKTGQLFLKDPTAPGRGDYLSAASGLVIVGAYRYAVADDENHLAIFDSDQPSSATQNRGTLLQLFPGTLPADKAARKKAKPDLEALTFLSPEVSGTAHGALLAIGSGSGDKRNRGALIPLNANGTTTGAVHEIDLMPLYEKLGTEFTELNIEGVAVSGSSLRLLQRGNGRAGFNAVVDLDLGKVSKALAAGGNALTPDMIASIQKLDLGSVPGVQRLRVPLTFTDLTVLPDGRSVFTAVAEDTPNAWEDGPIVGAAVGILAADGSLVVVQQFTPSDVKLEGISATVGGKGGIALEMVTDPDDPSQPATAYSADIEDPASQGKASP